MLLLYNFCNALLTWIVAPMSDAEERSGVSPPYRRNLSNAPQMIDDWQDFSFPYRWTKWWLLSWTESYGWMIWPHRFVQVVFLVAIISFAIHGYDWLQLPVTIPA